MRKTLLTTLLAVFLFASSCYLEQLYVKKTFKEFLQIIEITRLKLEGENPALQEVNGLEIFWLENKKKLHAVIPHNDIKEIDLWVSECNAYAKIKKYDEALCKLVVLKTLAEQIPRTFILRFENIF